MRTTTNPARRSRIITLTGRRPISIVEADWPVVARASTAQGAWRAQLTVRRHRDDGRAIVYATVAPWSPTRGERLDANGVMRAGDLVDRHGDVAAAIARVCDTLAERFPWVAALAADAVAKLPPEAL